MAGAAGFEPLHIESFQPADWSPPRNAGLSLDGLRYGEVSYASAMGMSAAPIGAIMIGEHAKL
jgi:hypothetical protein